jgi:putative multicomponent Na+:H+ antiporter subunit B
MTAPLTMADDLELLLPTMALLPLTAILLVSQGNPYQTLVLRGILGSVAALAYALLGAPDVALTETLVGTLLSTTLYAVALRSAMTLRLQHAPDAPPSPEQERLLRQWLAPLHLRLRLVASGEDPADPACHGFWRAGGRVVLRNPALQQRLMAAAGHGAWLAAGGCLELEP